MHAPSFLAPSQPNQGKAFSRWSHFGIRHLFFLTTLTAAILGPLVSLEMRVRREGVVSAAVMVYGGKVERVAVWPQWMPTRYRSAVTRVEIGKPHRSGTVDADPFVLLDRASPTESPKTAHDLIMALRALPCVRELNLSSAGIDGHDLKLVPRPFAIAELDVSFNKLGNDLNALGNFRNLRSLSLGHTDVDDDRLTSISTLTELEHLNISNTDVTDRGLAALASLSNLRSITLARTKVNGPGLVHLAGLRNLSLINMEQPSNTTESEHNFIDSAERAYEKALLVGEPTDGGSNCVNLSSMPIFERLNSLYLGNSVLDEASIISISRQPNLMTLDLSGSNIETAWVRHLSVTKLQWLYLSDTALTGSGIEEIARIPSLRCLRIERLRISPQDLSIVAKLPNLEYLAVDQIRGASEVVRVLEQLPSLKSLQITNSGLTQADVDRLATFRHLESLNVEGNPVKEPKIIDLRFRRSASGRTPLEL